MWRSPMVLLTGAALLVGVAVVAFALLSQPSRPTDEVVAPLFEMPNELASGRTLGRAEAPVTVEIWSDFQCPGCMLLATRIEPSLVGQYVVPGIARFVYRDAAFQGEKVARPHDESVEAAAAARCAAEQDRFWPMHGWLFANWNGENEFAFRAERLREIAAGAGLELAAYDACMATGERQAAVRAETDEGVALGVGFTPTLVVNGTPYSGQLTVADIGAAISAAAGGATPAPAASGAP